MFGACVFFGVPLSVGGVSVQASGVVFSSVVAAMRLSWAAASALIWAAAVSPSVVRRSAAALLCRLTLK